MALEVFISHSHRDQKIAAALVNFLNAGVGLETREIRCTSYSPAGLLAGNSISSELRRDIKRCKYFLPLITSNTPTSEFVAFEIGAAWILEKDTLPLIYKKKARQELPTVLSDLIYTDLTDLDALVRLASRLAGEIYVKSDQPTPAQMLTAAQTFLASVKK